MKRFWTGAGAGPAALAALPGETDARRLRLVAFLLGLLTFLWIFPQLDEVGVTWDEPHYFAAVARIQDWAGQVLGSPDRAAALSAEGIADAWDRYHYWNPHPPVYKEAMAATGALLGRSFGSLVSYRSASVLWFALLVGSVAWAGGLAGGMTAGVGSALALLLMPRVVGHAHIGATDMPLTFFWFLATVGFALYVLADRPGYLAAAALGLGLALGTKFTGYLIPLPLALWLLLYGRRLRFWGGLVAWGLGGLLIGFALNPLAWHDPLGYPLRLAAESLGREDGTASIFGRQLAVESVPISTFYLGRTYLYRVPWHHPLVMTLATLPVALLGLAGIGTARARRWRERPLLVLSLVQVIFFWVLMALPSSPNHDGIRLFLPMFPFVALLAGSGFARTVEALGSWLGRSRAPLAGLALGLLFFYPPYLQLTRARPYFLAYYGEAIGGVRGAQRAGLETSYWFDAITPAFLMRVNEILPEGAGVASFPHPLHLEYLQSYGMLREDLDVREDGAAPYLILLARRASFTRTHRAVYENVKPILAAEYGGVELAGLYTWSEEDRRRAEAEEP